MGHPDLLTRKHRTQFHLPFLVTNPSTRRHDGGRIVQGIFQLTEAVIRPRRRLVVIGRHPHVQGVVRPLVVVAREECIEGCLLLPEIRRGRFGCLAFERQVHPLVASVLLRMPRLDPFEPNAEA